jgi:hypothetical protein
MAERYAAAHARREQRRRQTATRDYLPLPEDGPIDPTGTAAMVEMPRSSVSTAAMRLPSVDYSYLRGDLLRTAVLAAILFAIMIILALILHV